MKISNKNRKRIQEQQAASYGSAVNYGAEEPIPTTVKFYEIDNGASRQYQETVEQIAQDVTDAIKVNYFRQRAMQQRNASFSRAFKLHTLWLHYQKYKHIWPTT